METKYEEEISIHFRVYPKKIINPPETTRKVFAEIARTRPPKPLNV
jgi:hypothetical protein